MAATYEYIISLRDKVSGTMQRVAGASTATVGRLTALSKKARELQGITGDLSGSVYHLKQRIDLLQQEKELLDPSNLSLVKQYNREIDNLTGQLERLDNAGRGGKLKSYLGDIGGMVKGILNPVTLGAAAIGFSGKSAMNFREGMAKVNITAQLDERGLANLESKIKNIASANKFDIGVAPGAFEQIISQTADVEMSLDVLDAALKGSKAGFTDLETVAGALAQTMSILGGSASSLEVLDTFFAAKRVGAGEFKDFATYMPGLIASADALGVKYQSVAGVFAYMTGKGQDAARASVLIGNMFSAMSKTDITTNLSRAGVKIFDATGKTRDFVDIFRDLGAVMAGMNDEQKTAFLEKIGIVDKEAKAAFAIMGSDLDKLVESMDATANAAGETSAALEYSKNPIQTVTELWNQFKAIGLQVGDLLVPVIGVGLSVLGRVLSGVSAILSGVISFFSGWGACLREGNPLVWGITAALGALTIALVAHETWVNRAAIATRAKAAWDGLVAAATGGWTAVQWTLNAALYACPLVWIVALVVGLIAAIVACCTRVQGWGKQWDVVVQFMKNTWDLFVETFKLQWNLMTFGLLTGLDKIKLGWYKFKEAVGLGNPAENKAMIEQLNADVENRKRAIIDGANKVKELARKTASSLTWELSWKKDEATGGKQPVPGSGKKPGGLPVPGAVDFDALMKKIGKTENGKNRKEVLDLNEFVTNGKGDTAYSAIASRLTMVKMPTVQPVTLASPVPASPVNNINVPGVPAPVVNVDNTSYSSEGKTRYLQGILDGITRLGGIAATIATAVAMPGDIPGNRLPVSTVIETGVPVNTGNPVPEIPVLAIAPGLPVLEKGQDATPVPGGRQVYLDKFCEQVVINVQNTDQRGTSEIEETIISKLTSIFDPYEA